MVTGGGGGGGPSKHGLEKKFKPWRKGKSEKSNKKVALKQQLRGHERLLSKLPVPVSPDINSNDPPDTRREELVAKIEALKSEISQKAKSLDEKKMATQSHGQRFLDRQKLTRQEKQVRKSLDDDANTQQLLYKLALDQAYVAHHPNDVKYMPLFSKGGRVVDQSRQLYRRAVTRRRIVRELAATAAAGTGTSTTEKVNWMAPDQYARLPLDWSIEEEEKMFGGSISRSGIAAAKKEAADKIQQDSRFATTTTTNDALLQAAAQMESQLDQQEQDEEQTRKKDNNSADCSLSVNSNDDDDDNDNDDSESTDKVRKVVQKSTKTAPPRQIEETSSSEEEDNEEDDDADPLKKTTTTKPTTAKVAQKKPTPPTKAAQKKPTPPTKAIEPNSGSSDDSDSSDSSSDEEEEADGTAAQPNKKPSKPSPLKAKDASDDSSSSSSDDSSSEEEEEEKKDNAEKAAPKQKQKAHGDKDDEVDDFLVDVADDSNVFEKAAQHVPERNEGRGDKSRGWETQKQRPGQFKKKRVRY
jgi:hypothetical protein